MTRRRLWAILVPLIGAWALLAAPAGAATPTWSVVPSPSPGSGYNILSGVSCVSAARCTAVGYDRFDTPPYAFHTVIESWNGTTWSVVPSPTPGPNLSINVNGVSCVSASACTAVGWFYYVTSGTIQTFVESWNGTKWSVVPSPSPASSNFLNGVSCVSASACTAVGYDYDSYPTFRTLAESWNGTSWSVVPSPDRISGNILNGVSCASATACMAVGSHGDRHFDRTLIESWNGTAWSLVTSPNPGSTHDGLGGVSCPSVASCTAVGEDSSGSVDRTLVESWNGTKWSVMPSPTPGSPDDLNGVSCAAGACTAVGSNGRKTLIESGP